MKKKFKDTALGKFLKNKAPSILEIVGDVFTPAKVLSRLIASEPSISVEDKIEAQKLIQDYEIESFQLEVEDRKSARSLFSKDSIIQKIFAIVFLLSYGAMVWYMLDMLSGNRNESELFKTMVTMIFTHTSNKLSTIIDFLFGGSVGKDNK